MCADQLMFRPAPASRYRCQLYQYPDAASGVRWRRVRSVKELATEGRIGAGLGAVGLDQAVAAQVVVEAMDLIAVAGLEEANRCWMKSWICS